MAHEMLYNFASYLYRVDCFCLQLQGANHRKACPGAAREFRRDHFSACRLHCRLYPADHTGDHDGIHDALTHQPGTVIGRLNINALGIWVADTAINSSKCLVSAAEAPLSMRVPKPRALTAEVFYVESGVKKSMIASLAWLQAEQLERPA
jgi:hypothetical protein